MPTQRKTTKKQTTKARKTAQPRSRTARKRVSRRQLRPPREARGLPGTEIVADPRSPELKDLSDHVEEAGGTLIGAYHEPLSGHPMLIAALPLRAVVPTPFQRDLSPTHAKRLAEKIDASGSFLDPLIVVRGSEGELWTPNGRHRLAAAKTLGLRMVTCLISADETLAFKILALNTEKAHNLKDRSLEVFRMAQTLSTRHKRARECDYAEEFEEASLLTLGTVYSQSKRFAGSAYHPFLKKVDRFSKRTLPASLRERVGYAARLLEIDDRVKQIIEALKQRGFKSPYLRSYVVARINPVRFHHARAGATAPALPIGSALTRMAGSVRSFDVASVRERDLALVAALTAE